MVEIIERHGDIGNPQDFPEALRNAIKVRRSKILYFLTSTSKDLLIYIVLKSKLRKSYFYLQPYELPICRFPDTAYGGSIQYKSKQKITNPISKEVTEVITQLID